jgi:MSHA pilin protein MshD
MRMKDRACPNNIYAKQRGVTLVELIITIVVLGVALSALVSALSEGVAQSSTPLWEGKALELQQAYLDEILAMNFDDTTPVGGGEVDLVSAPCTLSNEGQSRAQFDDVDDYHNINDTPPVLIESSINMSEYAQYKASVTVACAGIELGLSQNHLAKRIVVSIIAPGGQSRSVAVYKGNF